VVLGEGDFLGGGRHRRGKKESSPTPHFGTQERVVAASCCLAPGVMIQAGSGVPTLLANRQSDRSPSRSVISRRFSTIHGFLFGLEADVG
jgi:hypothetical protein